MGSPPPPCRSSARILHVRLLGAVEVSSAGRRVAGFPTRKSRSLFAFLALNRRKQHLRCFLAESFWPDSEARRSRAALRTELWRIRSTIARTGVDPHHVLTEFSDAVSLRPEAPCRFDVDTLDEAIGACHPGPLESEELAALESALHLYSGDLLEGDDEEWCAANREYYRARYFTGLSCVIESAMATEDWPRAIQWCERLLIHDPLAEHVYRYLMICHNALGNRPAALRQFARCTAVLRAELDVEPMERTADLHRRILEGRPEPRDLPRGPRISAATLRRARASLTEAVRSLDNAIEHSADADD